MRDASQIQDAIAQIPDNLRVKVLYLLGELQSDSAFVRENAIHHGHSLAAQLKEIADRHVSSPLITDSCRPVCARAADLVYAHMDEARRKSSNGNETPVQIGDAQTEYQRMLQRDADAWKHVK
jgi:hypothetical protein